MTSIMPVAQVRADLDAALDLVCHGPVVLDEHGKTRAVLISAEDFECFQEFVSERFAQTIERIHRANAAADPVEMEREVRAAVEEVRQAAYERSREAESGRR